MKYLFFVFLVNATSFSPIPKDEPIQKSDVIVVAKILQKSCLDKNGIALKAYDSCTGPGISNKLTYTLKVKEVLYPKKERKKIPSEIKLAFAALSHWDVPRDEYASEIGDEYIFFLMKEPNGDFGPFHEMAYTAPVKDKKKILNKIKKLK